MDNRLRMERQKIARSARWGTACASCVAAKTRCVRGKSPGSKCDRCQSLEKQCSEQLHGPRKKRHAKSSKTAQLEERLNSLIDSLKALEEGESLGSLLNNYHSQSSSSTSTTCQSHDDTPSQDESMQDVPASGLSSSVPPFTRCSCMSPVNKEDHVPFESDETLLSIYMNHLSPRFPFVIIPRGTTAGQLETSRPLLIPECPDLSVPQTAGSSSPSTISIQTLSTLRSQILAQPSLQVDIFGIVDAMVIRFEAAKREMAAAHGAVWENDTWNLAAEHLKMKRLRLEKWCEITAIVASKERLRFVDASNSINEESGGILNIPEGRRTINYFDWPVSSNDQGNAHWESDLFDELMRDIHPEGILDTPGDWDSGILDNMG